MEVMGKQTSWVHFLTCFSADQDKIDVVLKQFKLNILMLLLIEIFKIRENNLFN